MRTNNEFTELVSNSFMNTDKVIRYSMTYQANPEPLSTHILEVQIISYLIALKLKINYNEEICIEEVLSKSLLHDMDEVITGDIVRTTKYHNEEIHTNLDLLASTSIKRISEELGYPEVYTLWESSKSGKEGLLVKMADMLCVVNKCIREIKILGNQYFQKVAYEMKGNLIVLTNDILDNYDQYSDESKRYLIKILEGAYEEVEDLIDEDILNSGLVTYNLSKPKNDDL